MGTSDWMTRYIPTFIFCWEKLLAPALAYLSRRLAGPARTFVGWLKKAALVAAAILVLLAIAHTIANVVMHRLVESKLAEIKAGGGVIALPDFAPSGGAVGWNAAVVYEHATEIVNRVLNPDLLSFSEKKQRRGFAGVSAGFGSVSRPVYRAKKTVKAFLYTSCPTMDLPFSRTRFVKGDNGTVLTTAISLEELITTISAEEVLDEVRNATRKHLEEAQPDVEVADNMAIEVATRQILEEMDRGIQMVKEGRELPGAWYHINYWVRPAGAMSHWGVHCVDLVTPCVSAAAVLAARDGDMNEAFDLISAALHLVNSIRDHPKFSVQLLRAKSASFAISAMQAVLDEHHPPDAHLQEILAELAELRDREYFVRGIQGERCIGIDWYRWFRSPPPPVYSDRPGPSWEHRLPSGGVLGALALYLRRPLSLLDELGYLDAMARLVDLAALPAYKSRDKLADLAEESESISKLEVIARLDVSVYAKAFDTQDRLVAQCDLAEIAIRLKQYKMRTGSYPQKLDAIMPGLARELSLDPFSGKSYIYRAEEDGFILYSVASNQIDDGGRPDWREGDIVWRSSR